VSCYLLQNLLDDFGRFLLYHQIMSHLKARKHLKKVDPKLAAIIDKYKLKSHKPTGNHFEYLVGSIISQQLSTKVADVFEKRFIALYRGTFPTPKQVLKTPHATLRSIGLSNSKAHYIKNIAEHISKKKINLKHIEKMENEAVITELTKIKGVGRWTAEMFLMFSLNRPDVFSHGDLGLNNAIIKLYKLKKPSRKRIERIIKKWSPYKTLASRYLWASLDNK
jgi:DNA-3-methyladenine glycosylase II